MKINSLQEYKINLKVHCVVKAYDTMLKNFCFKVYPVSLNIHERWYLSFLHTDKYGRIRPKKVAVSFKLKTAKERFEAIEQLKKVIEGGYTPKPVLKKPVAANSACQKIKEAFDTHKAELRAKSASSYKTHIKKFDTYCKENSVEVVTEATANDFLNDLRTKGLSGVTINNHRRTLKSFFKKLRASKVINKNVFDGTKKRKEAAKAREYFRVQQRKTILDWCLTHDKPLVIAIQLIFYCFIRPGEELTGLRVGDVNMDDLLLTVKGSIAKNGLTERVKIPRQMAKVLETMALHKYPNNYFLLGTDGIPSEKKVSIHAWNKRHVKALEGVYGVSPLLFTYHFSLTFLSHSLP